MTGRIEVKGWDAAQSIAVSLAKNGYQVLISTDMHSIEEDYIYIIEFVNPNWDGIYFEATSDEEKENQRWEEIEEENFLEGLEHLDNELPKKKVKKK
jgi:DNA-binding LacI/PurR family transcriptional regulator